MFSVQVIHDTDYLDGQLLWRLLSAGVRERVWWSPGESIGGSRRARRVCTIRGTAPPPVPPCDVTRTGPELLHEGVLRGVVEGVRPGASAFFLGNPRLRACISPESSYAWGMNYDEACDSTVTQDEALAEIRSHGFEPPEFFAEVGTKDQYIGQEVLDWLGY